MIRTVLLTLGRLPKALDLARGFSDLGCTVIVAEPFRHHLAGTSKAVAQSFVVTPPRESAARYCDDLLRIVETERVDLIVPVSEEALHASAIKPRLPSGARMVSEDQTALLALHDKRRFVETANAYGLTVPETYVLGTQDAEALARRQSTVVKHVYSCSGTGLQFVDQGGPLPDAQLLPPSIVQARLNGRHISTFSYVHEGHVLVTAMYTGLVISGTVAVAFERIEAHDAIAEWVDTFASKAGYSGFLSFDFIEDDAGVPHAIECNPRATSGVHFIEPASLAHAIIHPDTSNKIRFKRQTRYQQFFPCLTEAWNQLIQGKQSGEAWKTLVNTPDAMWRWTDPMPLFLMTFSSHEILRQCIFEGLSFGEAATRDIEWYEAPASQKD